MFTSNKPLLFTVSPPYHLPAKQMQTTEEHIECVVTWGNFICYNSNSDMHCTTLHDCIGLSTQPLSVYTLSITFTHFNIMFIFSTPWLQALTTYQEWSLCKMRLFHVPNYNLLLCMCKCSLGISGCGLGTSYPGTGSLNHESCRICGYQQCLPTGQ